MDIDELITYKLVHEIHTSERRSFRACRRRWDWLFRQNYYPIVTAKPLEFGVAYHKAMETYYDPVTWGWDREVIAAAAIQDFVTECEKQKTKAVNAVGHLYLEDEQELDYAERVELGKGMLNYYFTQIAPREDAGWKPVKVEIAFMVAIPNPETGERAIWCKCPACKEKWIKYLNSQFDSDYIKASHLMNWNGLPVVYAGRIDMLAVDSAGNYWIFDWKTARSISDRYDFLYLDDQISSYVWALLKLGLPVKGFVYHEQRKGYPQPPKQNKQRRLGCLFSVAKNQDVDYDTYLETVMAQDREAFDAGCYDEMLEYLRNEGVVYFARHQIAKSSEELLTTEHNIGLEALDIIQPNMRIYPSAGRFGCSFCSFQQPCMEKNANGDYQYALDTMFERREHYYVREQPSTESKGGE